MIANQTTRGLRSAARWIGLLGSSVALLAACGGSIEQTDVDQQHLENNSNGKQLTKAPEAATPAKTTPAASSQTAAAPAPTTPKPAAAEPPPAADDTDPPAADDPPASTTTTSADLKFETDIWPIFNTSCGPCHVAGSSGGQSIGSTDKTKALADAKSFKDAIISDISSGAMPLGCAKPPGGGGNCVSAEDFADIKAWFDAGAPK
jgi:hypothetical protein